MGVGLHTVVIRLGAVEGEVAATAFAQAADEQRAPLALGRVWYAIVDRVDVKVIEEDGVSPQLLAGMHDMRREYFALPHWQKMAQKMPPDRYRG